MPMPVFQQWGTMSRLREAASSHTRIVSVSPPARPTSGWATEHLRRHACLFMAQHWVDTFARLVEVVTTRRPMIY